MDAQNDLTTWVSSIPKITRWWFFSFFIVPLTTRLGLLDPMSLVLVSEFVFSKFQVCPLQSHLLLLSVDVFVCVCVCVRCGG